MKDYKAIIVALEKYHNNIRPVKHALDDAEAIRDALLRLGCPQENICLLLNELATKTSILDRVAEFSSGAQSYETIVFYFAGHGLLENDINYLLSVDTNVNRLSATAIPINQILSDFDKSDCKKVIVFLDCCHSGISFAGNERSAIKDFSADVLKYHYSEAEHLIVFASCKDNEKSQVDMERKHGVWSYFLLQALSGRVPELYQDNLLFSDNLHRYLYDETRRRAWEITDPKKNQTPMRYGKETLERFIVADLTELQKKSNDLISRQLDYSTIQYSGRQQFDVNKLKGFRQGYRIPKAIDDHHRNWIEGIAHDDVKDLANKLIASLRRGLDYKSDDFAIGDIIDGEIQIEVKQFRYDLKITQSSLEAHKCLIERKLYELQDSARDQDAFNFALGKDFDQLTVDFIQPIDINGLIKHAETLLDQNYVYDYDAVGKSKFVIHFSGYPGSITIRSRQIVFNNRDRKYPKELFDAFVEKMTILKDLIS